MKTLRWKDQDIGRPILASGRSRIWSTWISFAMAYIEMPDERIVITANRMALKPRVFSSNRSRRNSGTDRAREP